MSDRKQQIIEAALRCFSRQGYEATSIQEIVDELGMAKGSIYFYFKSKDDLFLAVIAHMLERVMTELAALPEERSLPPREQFRLQLGRYFRTIMRNREFPAMMMREPPPMKGRHSQMQSMLKGMRLRYMRWLRERIDAVYGPAAAVYAGDAAALFSGMMMEYNRLLFLEEPDYSAKELAEFLVDRMDDVMTGMVRSGAKPLLRREFERSGDEADRDADVRSAVGALRRSVEGSAEEASRMDVLAALDRFEAEFAKPLPDRIVLRGMLAFMRELAVDDWRPALGELDRRLGLHEQP